MVSYYRDSKTGDICLNLNTARLTSAPDKRVTVYAVPRTGEVWARPFDEFYGEVDGARRFQPVHEAEAKRQLRRERRGLLRG